MSDYFLLLAHRALLSLATVERVYKGRRCEWSTHVRLTRAAADLGLPPPPPMQGQRPSLDVARIHVEATVKP